MSEPARSDADERRVILAQAYAQVFETGEGKTVLADLLREGGVLSIAHEPGDPFTTAWNDGKRALALHIVERLRWSDAEMVELAKRRSPPSDAADAAVVAEEPRFGTEFEEDGA